MRGQRLLKPRLECNGGSAGNPLSATIQPWLFRELESSMRKSLVFESNGWTNLPTRDETKQIVLLQRP
jgi:hypothetical protein